MATFVDQFRTKVRTMTARKGAGGLAEDMKFLDNIKATRSVVQSEGFIGVSQRAVKGERLIMGKMMPGFFGGGKAGAGLGILDRLRKPAAAGEGLARTAPSLQPVSTIKEGGKKLFDVKV